MDISRLIIYIVIMAGVTYLIRMLPLVIFRKKIENQFIKSFLYYIPYAVLGAMVFPAILYSTGSIWSAIFGLAAAILLSYLEKGLLTVALASCGVVFIVEFIIRRVL